MTTKQATHTPGPWDARAWEILADSPGRPDARMRVVADAGVDRDYRDWPISSDEADANARLIAAAPDLLEACKDLIDWRECHADRPAHLEAVISEARAAIAKAEGN